MLKEISDKYPDINEFSILEEYTKCGGEMKFIALSLFNAHDLIINITEEKESIEFMEIPII